MLVRPGTVRIVALLALLLTAFPTKAAPRPIAQPAPGGAIDYTLAMRSGLAADARRTDLPQYDLNLTVDPVARRLSGEMRLTLPNRTGRALSDVVLRLYPQFPPDVFGDGGNVKMEIRDIMVQGVATSGRYEAQRTAIRLPLPSPVAPNGTISLSLSYTANIVPWQRSDGTFPLPSFYPMLAVWQDGWRTDVTRFPDHVYANSALYRARITVPTGWTAISSGSLINTIAGDGTTTFEAVTGPVREFAFSVGRLVAARASHNGVEIAVWHRAGDGLDAAAAEIARQIAAAVATYDSRFGLYPYRTLQLHLINAQRGFDIGVEYPGLMYILLNGRYTTDTRFVTAHEVAHQWFYGVVGDDIYNEPWLDEGFAQYSATLVEEQWGGKAAAARVYDRQIVRLAARTKLPAGLSLTQYGAWNSYYAAVYGRGAQFLGTLRSEIGDDAFFAGLQRYYATQKYGVAQTVDVKAAFEQSSGRNLDALFKRWIGR